jgi:hypothetical protein
VPCQAFNDLRGTFVTRSAIAGGTEPEIGYITGHSLRGVRAIIDIHYLHRDPALGENLIGKLERGTEVSNRGSNRPKLSDAEGKKG